MLPEIFVQIDVTLTKLRQLKLGGPVIMPYVCNLFYSVHFVYLIYEKQTQCNSKAVEFISLQHC